MLLAELHGKYDVAVRDHEDYLTSTVFGHLRYISPGPFWSALFSKAKTLPVGGFEKSLTDVAGKALAKYETLTVTFWPKCAGLGEPELAICFSGGDQKPLVVLVEVKLLAEKSGRGEYDQLKRYLQIAANIDALRPPVPAGAQVFVVYLTPRESSSEVLETLQLIGDSDDNRCRLFRLQWQDMVDIIGEIVIRESVFAQAVLTDVRDFLRLRGLEYFNGCREVDKVERLKSGCGSFYERRGVFQGFHVASNLRSIKVINGDW